MSASRTRKKTSESRSLIRLPDRDPFDPTRNARYLDYFINAR